MAKTKVPGGYISDEAITVSHLHSSHGITTNDIGEHTNNKYYTDARVDARLAASKSTNFVTTGSITAGKVILASGNKVIFGGDDTYNAHLQYTDNGSGDHFLSIKTEHNDTITERAKFHAGTGAITFSGDTSFGDNIKVNFGDGSDLQIFHDSQHSFVHHAGTGALKLKEGSADAIVIDGGVVNLNHSGTTKLVTKADGVDITGELQSDSLDVDGNADISGNLVLGGNLTVTGTTTTVNTVTMNAQNAVVFEGATADDYETTLTIIDPTADRTINLPNQSGTIPVLAAASNTAITATPAELNYVDGVTSNIQTQLDAKQATISSSTDLTLSSIVTSSSNETRLKSLFVGADSDIYLYESATNAFTIRTGTSGAYKYFTFAADGKLNLASDGLQIGGTEVISGGRNISNVGTVTASGVITASSTSGHRLGRLTLRDDSIEEQQTNTDTATVAISYNGYSGGTTKFRDFAIFDGKQAAVARFTGSDKTLNVVGGYKLNGTTVIDSSRNLTNIGTISSGAITSTGSITSSSSGFIEHKVDQTDSGLVRMGVSSGSAEAFIIAGNTGGNHVSSAPVIKFMLDTDGGSLVEEVRIDAAGLDIKNGTLDIAGTTVIDSSRNLTNIGTISSGAITSSGQITSGGTIQADLLKGSSSGTNNYINFNDDTTTYGDSSNTTTVASIADVAIATNTNDGGGGDFIVATGSTGTKRFEVSKTGVVTHNNAYSFPTADGTNGQVLTTNGSGTLSFTTVSSGGSGFSTITEPSAGQLKIGAQSGANEGGEILLENAAANGGGSYTTDIYLDNYQNQFRIHAASAVRFSVGATTGNTTVGGTLGVTGDLTASGNLTVDDKLIIGDATANSNSFIEFGERITASETNKPFIGQTNSGNSTSQDLGIGVRSSSGVIKFFAGNTAAFTESYARAIIASTYINFTEPLQMAGNQFVDENRKITLSSAHTKQKIEVYGGGHEWIGTSANTLELSGASINLNGGQGTGSPTLKYGGTTIMDSSRVLQNVTANASIITSGTINSARLATGGSGNWWAGNVAKVATDGVMEVGRYIDFHNTDTTTADYDVRLDANTANSLNVTGVSTTDGLRVEGNKVWHAGNDGPDSGLNADLLDGIGGDGYLRSNAADTATGSIVFNGATQYFRRNDTTSYTNAPLIVESYGGSSTTTGIGFHISGQLGRYLRMNSSGVLAWEGSTIWHAGNDGSGSGLDADLLDGQHGSYYARKTYWPDATTRLGATTHSLTNLNTTALWSQPAGYQTMVRASNSNGLPSGHGQSYFGYQITSRRDTGGGYSALLTAYDNSNMWFTYQSASTGYPTWRKLWHDGNDGTGSGLDADTVDGVQASSFLRSDTADTATGNITLGASTKLIFGNNTSYGIGAGGHNYRSGYFDTLESGGDSDPLELVYYRGNKVNIGTGGGNKPLSAGSFEITGTSVINSSRQLQNIASLDSTTTTTIQNAVEGTGLNADTLDGLELHTGRNNVANRVVRTDANGYIQAGWINTTSGSTTSVIDRIYASYDGYIRYYTPANYFNAGGMGEKQFNNQGRNHSTYTDFNTAMPAGVHYLQQGSNGPTGTTSHQFYGMKFGLGNEYGTSGSGGSDYSAQMYFPRAAQGGGNGLYFRDKEGGSYGSWRQVDAGTLGTLSLKSSSGQTGADQVIRSASNGYIYHKQWIDVGGTGLFSGTANSGHFLINQNTSYGTWRSTGSRGGYDGLVLDGGGGVAFMTDGSGNGGIYRQASSRWYNYHHVGNACTGFNGSTTSSSYTIYATGAIYATGDIVGSSDERLKTEIKTIPNALDKVLKLRGVTYKWKDTTEGGTCVNNITETRMGVIAQEVIDILPEVVTHDKENDRYGVSYGHLTGVLIEAVKELKQEVNELKKELEEVKNG